MLRHMRNLGRLVRAAWVLSRYDALFAIDAGDPPAPIRAARSIARLRQRLGGTPLAEGSEGDRLAAALTELGPSYIKLGQFLATRPDVIEPALARDLAKLQDRLPPFETAIAKQVIAEDFGKPADEVFSGMGDALAAASIAQVHKATVPGPDGMQRDVAVKVLRPGIEDRFQADLDSFFWVARLIHRAVPSARRLKPIDVVQTLADSVALEMDLRLEAAALSEMAERTSGDAGFRTPAIDWERTSKRVMTLEWIDGIPIADTARLDAAGLDRKAVAANVITTFLTHAVREGYFHADMHPGNLFVEADNLETVGPGGTLVAVDYGIMGRLNPKESRFLAEILFGFVMRDYRRVAEVHFEAGYVPETKSVDAFAQALRAIGEPILGREASEISMARLLAQLFEVTGQFDMETRPELIMLQKTMVVVEGVARDLDPDFNMWETAEPILRQWLESRIGPEGRLQDAVRGAERMGRLMGDLPDLLETAERAARSIAGPGGTGVAEGLKLHPETAKAIADAQAERERPGRIALWVGAAALAVLAVAAVF